MVLTVWACGTPQTTVVPDTKTERSWQYCQERTVAVAAYHCCGPLWDAGHGGQVTRRRACRVATLRDCPARVNETRAEINKLINRHGFPHSPFADQSRASVADPPQHDDGNNNRDSVKKNPVRTRRRNNGRKNCPNTHRDGT